MAAVDDNLCFDVAVHVDVVSLESLVVCCCDADVKAAEIAVAAG